MRKNILVTGGLGHIGSQNIRKLDHDITVLDNLSTQRYCSLFELDKKINFVESDFSELDSSFLSTFDEILHFGAITDAAGSFDNKEELDKVMFIVEDVTELEKLAAEKAAKDKEIATINEIASNKIDDVKAFILSADSYIKNSIKPLEDFKGDQSKAGGLGEIFRNLHTLKGNSRIFNLGTGRGGQAHR